MTRLLVLAARLPSDFHCKWRCTLDKVGSELTGSVKRCTSPDSPTSSSSTASPFFENDSILSSAEMLVPIRSEEFSYPNSEHASWFVIRITPDGDTVSKALLGLVR